MDRVADSLQESGRTLQIGINKGSGNTRSLLGRYCSDGMISQLMCPLSGLLVFSALFAAGSTGCRDGNVIIPAGELAEIRRQAFEHANSYLMADEAIEVEYEKRRAELRETREAEESECPPGGGKTFLERIACALDEGEEEAEEEYARVLAAAEVRGVQLQPISRVKCKAYFNFVPTQNPLAQLPPEDFIFERFETTNGDHYWVIR